MPSVAPELKRYLLTILFQGQAPPAALWVGLSSKAETDAETLADVAASEITSAGYKRQPVEPKDWTLKPGALEVSMEVFFVNTGQRPWAAAKAAFVATSEDNSGVLVAATPFRGQRIVMPGDRLHMPVSVSLE